MGNDLNVLCKDAAVATRSRVPSFAFVGWNPFQIRHALEVAQALENSCFIIEKRRKHVFTFEEDLLTETGVPSIILSTKNIHLLDGLFDVFICQTPFKNMETIQQSRIAMIQYGYAKAGHNYGSWRALAHLNLLYGDHAARHIKPMSPVVVTGNPAFDKWHDASFQEAVQAKFRPSLDPSKKTLIYAPTWGDLSTSPIYLKEVISLTDEYNVILKLHHNTDLLEKRKSGRMSSNAPISFGANVSLLELMTVSDVLLSDYSGAIFDALYCELPIVLLHHQSEKRVGDKFHLDSPEYSDRHQIGPVVESTGKIRQTVRDLLSGKLDFRASNKTMREDLYLSGPGSVQRAAAALQNLALGKI